MKTHKTLFTLNHNSFVFVYAANASYVVSISTTILQSRVTFILKTKAKLIRLNSEKLKKITSFIALYEKNRKKTSKK